MRNVLYAAVIVLLILHQDFWLWRDSTLVWGFLPAGLFYHAAYTLAAALLMGLLARFAWPKGLADDAKADSH